MQPTYLPWSGYFSMMDAVDKFILLDTVQFDKRSWQQRNRIKTPNGAQWLTIPVKTKGRSTQQISEVEIESDRDFPTANLKSIRHNYKRSACFGEYVDRFEQEYYCHDNRLSVLTTGLIRLLANWLGITAEITLASEYKQSGAKSDLLVSICREVGATEYITPPGSLDYLSSSTAFPDAGIKVKRFDYEHPIYRQLYGDFIPYMSVIDLLFNHGNKSAEIMRSGFSGLCDL